MGGAVEGEGEEGVGAEGGVGFGGGSWGGFDAAVAGPFRKGGWL